MITAILVLFYKCLETILMFFLELFFGVINFVFVLIQTILKTLLQSNKED